MIYEKHFENLEGIKRMDTLKVQIESYELYLKEVVGNKDSTIDIKIKHLIDFIYAVNKVKRNKGFDYNRFLLDYVKDGKFNDDIENVGTEKYRKDIYRNVMDGLNFICQSSKYENLINPLSNDDKKEIKKFDNPKFTKMISDRMRLDKIQNIEKEILKDIGIKLHVDENGKGFVYSHELSKVLGIKNKNILRDIRNILDKFDRLNLEPISKLVDFTVVEDKYEFDKFKGNQKIGLEKRTTYKIYEDLLMQYILNLSPKSNSNNYEKVLMAKIKYQSAFKIMKEMIEQLLKERIELKNNIAEFMNQTRKKNRDLMLKVNKLEKSLNENKKKK